MWKKFKGFAKGALNISQEKEQREGIARFIKNGLILTGIVIVIGVSGIVYISFFDFESSHVIELIKKAIGLRGLTLIGAIILGFWGLLFAAHRVDISKKTLRNDSLKRINTGYSELVPLLGHGKAAVRQGAIYALGEHAKENKKWHKTIIRVVASYIRSHSIDEDNNKIPVDVEAAELKNNNNKIPVDVEAAELKNNNNKIPVDVEAALFVLKHRNTTYDSKLEGDSNKKEWLFDISSSKIANGNLNHTELCNVNMSEIELSNCSFFSTKFKKSSIISGRFENKCEFDDAEFNEADMTECSATDCKFTKAKFNEADMTDFSAIGCKLSKAEFKGTIWKGATFESCDFSDATFESCDFSDATFESCDFARAVFESCEFSSNTIKNPISWETVEPKGSTSLPTPKYD